jgi:hypothetical protein
MRRPGDTTPDPPGGRAAERLRMFENARRPPEPETDSADRSDTMVKKRPHPSPTSTRKRSADHAGKKRKKR